jgi:hypothetical protein
LGYTPIMKYSMYIYMHILVGGLEHEFYFPYIGNSHPNWLSYFSEGLKPPTSYVYIINIYIYTNGGLWLGHSSVNGVKLPANHIAGG